MSHEAFERGDWQAVIAAHPLESHDPEEWLRYGMALLQTLTTGPDVGKQQQQAALAFVQAQREGASAERVAVAQRQSVLISLTEALGIAGCNEAAHRVRLAMELAGVAQRIERNPDRERVDLLHLHGFKCAGSTLIWSLERATNGRLLYLESDQPNRRLPWQCADDYMSSLKQKPLAITSHLMSLPPQDELALIKVAMIRKPLARIISAYRFETAVQGKNCDLAIDGYLRRYRGGMLSNYQTRHLSPQHEEDWRDRGGWGARPELIDLDRPDLFVGIVERYDESMVALEFMLEKLNIPIDLAYPDAKNVSSLQSDPGMGLEAEVEMLPSALVLEVTELDERLYQRAGAHLDQRVNAIPDFKQRLHAFRERCFELRQKPPRVKVKPSQAWTRLSTKSS